MVALKALLLPATVCAFVPSSRLPLAPRSVSGRTTVTAVYGTPRPVQIIPSVLPADWANMGADCKMLEEAGVDRIQFDVMDGNFVPNLTFGPEMIAACRKYTSVMFETQLMVSNYNCDTMLEQYTKVRPRDAPRDAPGCAARGRDPSRTPCHRRPSAPTASPAS